MERDKAGRVGGELELEAEGLEVRRRCDRLLAGGCLVGGRQPRRQPTTRTQYSGSAGASAAG